RAGAELRTIDGWNKITPVSSQRQGGRGMRIGLGVMVTAALFGLAAAIPVSLAQAPPKLALIAILDPGSAATQPTRCPATLGLRHGFGCVVPTIKEALAELGWVEGRTARFEVRYAD